MIDKDFGSIPLAQSIPADTAVHDLYSPAANKRAIVSAIIMANVTGSAAAASIFVDVDGNTKTTATAILYAKSIAANTTETLTFIDGLELGEDGTIGCQSGTLSAITYTVLGRKLDK